MNARSKKIIGVLSLVLILALALTGCMPAGDAAAAGDATTAGSLTQMVLPLVILFGVFYFFMIRPENKKKKEVQEMRSSLSNGDKVVTIGGISGTIVNIAGDYITIESGEDRVRIKLAKWAISRKEK